MLWLCSWSNRSLAMAPSNSFMDLIIPEVLPEDWGAHWDAELTNEQYHSDRSAVSSSSLKLVIEKSPKTFLAAHNGKLRKESPAFRIGSALHMAILEPELFQKKFVIQPEFSGKGAVAAKADWRLSIASDAVILKQEEYDDLQEMINSVLSHQDACNILKNGKAEQSGFFRDMDTGIKCRIRPDFFHFGHHALLDIKTTTDVRAEQFMKSIWNYRYDFQMGMYCEGIQLITGKAVQYPLILAVEKKAPFECALYLCDEALMTKGLGDFKIAIQRLKQCIDENMFDSYQRKIQPISLPHWALKEF